MVDEKNEGIPPTRVDAKVRSHCAMLASANTFIEFQHTAALLPRGEDGAISFAKVDAALRTIDISSAQRDAIRKLLENVESAWSDLVDTFVEREENRDPWIMVLLYNTNYSILQYQLFLERCDERAIQALLEKQDKIIENSIFSPREMVIACAGGKSALSGDVYEPISDAIDAALDRSSQRRENGLPPHTVDCLFILQALDRMSHTISLHPEKRNYYERIMIFALVHLIGQAIEPNASSILVCTCARAASHLVMLSASKADAADAESPRGEESTPFTHHFACMLLDAAEDALGRDKVHDINMFHDLRQRKKRQLEKIMEEAEAAGDMPRYCDAARDLSIMLRRSPPPSGSIEKSIEMIDLAIQHAEGLPALFRAELHNSRGITMRVAERYQDALVSYRIARDLTNFHTNTQEYLVYLVNIGACIARSDLLDHPDYKKEAQLAFDRVLETCAGNPDHKSIYCKASMMQAKVLYFVGSKYRTRALALLDWAIRYIESIPESDLHAEERADVLYHMLQWLNRDASPEGRRNMLELIRQHASLASKEYCDAAIETLQHLIEGRAKVPEIVGGMDGHDMLRLNVWAQFVMGWRKRLFAHAFARGAEFVRQHGDVLLNPSVLDEIQTFFSSVSSEDGRHTDETISYLRELIDEGQSRAATSAEEDGSNERVSDNKEAKKETRYDAEETRRLHFFRQLFESLLDTFSERTWSGTIRMLGERGMINASGAEHLSTLALLCKHIDSLKENEAMIRAHARMVELILRSGRAVVPHYVADDDRKFAINAAAFRMIQHASWGDAYTTLELHPHLMKEDSLVHLRVEAEEQGEDGDTWREIISFIECCRDNDESTALELFRSRNIEHFIPRLMAAEDRQELLQVARGLTGEDRRRGDRLIESVVRAGLQTNDLSRTIVIGSVLRTLREADWTQDEMGEPQASGDADWTRAEILAFIEAMFSVRESAYVHSLSNDLFQRFLAIANFIRKTFPDEAAASTRFIGVVQLLLDREALDQGGHGAPAFFLPASEMSVDVIQVIEEFNSQRASADQASAKIDMLLSRSEIVKEPGLVAPLRWQRAKCLFNDGSAPGWKRYSAAAAAAALVASDLSDFANGEQISTIKAEYLRMLVSLPGLDREIVGRVICELASEILRDKWNIDDLLLTRVVVSGLDGVNMLMRHNVDNGLEHDEYPLKILTDIVMLAAERIPERFVGTAWVRAKVLWVMAGVGGHDMQEEVVRSCEEEMVKFLEAYEAFVAHFGVEGTTIAARAIFQFNLARYRMTLTPELYGSETMRGVVEDVLRRLQALREDTRWSDPLLAAEVDRLLARARIRGVRNPNHEDFVESARLLLDAWENLGPDFDPELAGQELSILAGGLRAAEELELADQVFAKLFTALPFLVQYAMGPERRQFALRMISVSSRDWAAVRLILKGPAEALSILESGRALFLRERFAVERNARDQEDLDAYRSAIIAFDESVEALWHADPAQYLAPEISKLAEAKERAHAARWRLSAAIKVTPDTFTFESADPTKPLVVLFASDSGTIAMVGVKDMSAENAGSMRWEYETLGENVSGEEISHLVRGSTGWLRRDIETPNPDTVLSQLSQMLFEPVVKLLGRVGASPGTVVRYMGYGVFSAIPIAALSAGGKTFGDLYPVETLGTLHAGPASTMGARTFASETVTVFDNPSEDFAFGALDLELLQRHELVKDSFAGTQVTRANFVNALTSGARIHYSGHSIFDADDVSQSHFVLSSQERLTARELMLIIQRGQAREVFLSSCAAGVVGNGVSEEHEGLASAMLVAGANTVISALWPVDQIPTALLSLYYYLARREKYLSPAEALAWAQKKLRRTTAKQARDLLARLPTQRSLELSQLKGVRPLKIEPKPAISLRGVKPFVDSRHWAGFYCLSQT